MVAIYAKRELPYWEHNRRRIKERRRRRRMIIIDGINAGDSYEEMKSDALSRMK